MLRIHLFVFAISVFLLAGCSGGSDSDGTGTGTLTLGLTDAPIDDLDQVRIYITGITIKPESGPPESYDVTIPEVCIAVPGETDTCNPINLLALQGGVVMTVISDLTLDAGRYEWIRLEVREADSYAIEDSGGVVEIDIRIPSNRGLQLAGGFTILAGQTTSIMMDWDVRQGMTNPVGADDYILKPTIRITDLAEYGTIRGSVADTTCESTPTDGVVYVFQGDLSATPPADADANLDDIDNDNPNPLVTASVVMNDDMTTFSYGAHFLPAGTYTVALTCDEDNIPENETDMTADDDISFINPQVRTIADGDVAEANF
jgi:hypothetical protein